MAKHKIRFSCNIKAPPEKVFDFFADHESFGRIWSAQTTRIKVADDPAHPNGVGSVRRVKTGPVSIEETQVMYDRPRTLQYTVTKGGPIKNHMGTIRFSSDGSGGTNIGYSIDFDGKIPGIGGIVESLIIKDWQKGIAPIIAELETVS